MEGHERHVLYTEFELHDHDADCPAGGRSYARGKRAAFLPRVSENAILPENARVITQVESALAAILPCTLAAAYCTAAAAA